MKLRNWFLSSVFVFSIFSFGCSPKGEITSSTSSEEHETSTSIDDSSSSPKSDGVDFTLYSFSDIRVSNNSLFFSLDSEINKYTSLSSNELLDLSHYKVASGADVLASIEDGYLKYVVTSESKVNEKTYQYQLNCIDVFHPHSYCGYGLESAFDYVPDKGGYYLSSLGHDAGASFYYDGYEPLKSEDFSISFRARVEESEIGTEFKTILMRKTAQEARFVLRKSEEDKYLMFTDEKSSSSYVNYYVHKEEISGETFDIELIKHGNEALFILNNELLCRIDVGYLGDVELVLSTFDSSSVVSNLKYEMNKEEVASRYNDILNSTSYISPSWSKSITGNGHPEEFIVQNDGSTYIHKSDSTSRVIATPCILSEPLCGDYFYLSGHAKLENTPTSGSTAGKVEFQFYSVDGINYLKFLIYRYEGNTINNSIYLNYSNVLKSDYASLYKEKENVLALNDENGAYEFDYNLIFDRGVIYISIFDKDMSMPLWFSKDVGWSKASVIYGVNALVDATYGKITISKDLDEVRKIINQNFVSHNDLYSFKEGNLQKEFDSFYGEFNKTESTSYLYKNDKKCRNTNYLLDIKLSITDADNGSYASVDLIHDNNNAVRYMIKMNQSGTFDAVCYYKYQRNYYSSKTLINGNAENYSNLDIRIIALNGHYYFFINEECVKGIEEEDYLMDETEIAVAGYDSIVRASNLRYKTDTNLINQKLEDIKYHEEKSRFERRIIDYENKYASVTSSNLLLMGSSSFDYWYTFAEDLAPLKDVINVGIGGSGILDWNKFMLDRLVIKFHPKYIITFIGGNDLSAGVSMDEVIRQSEEAYLKLHAALPETKFYLLGQKPYVSTVEKMNQCKELNRRIKQIADKYDWIIRYIDNWDNYWEDESQNKLNMSYFKSDNMHLTEEGYKIWTAYVRAGISELYN